MLKLTDWAKIHSLDNQMAWSEAEASSVLSGTPGTGSEVGVAVSGILQSNASHLPSEMSTIQQLHLMEIK
jgi:hypothetical protein